MTNDAPRPVRHAIPAVPLALGLGGLIPFWALAIGFVAGVPSGVDPHVVSLALSTYAATILAFLGGVRWGLALRDGGKQTANFAVAVVPQLVGWGALALSDRWCFVVLGLAILVLGPADRRLIRSGVGPAWFGRLRMILSLGAGAALFAAALR